jgi:hypothetical protein
MDPDEAAGPDSSMNVNDAQVGDAARQLAQGSTTEDLIGTLIAGLHRARDICVGILAPIVTYGFKKTDDGVYCRRKLLFRPQASVNIACLTACFACTIPITPTPSMATR